MNISTISPSKESSLREKPWFETTSVTRGRIAGVCIASGLIGIAAASYAASPTLVAVATTIAGVAAQFFPAIPLVIAGYLLYDIYRLHDYENPDCLKRYKEEAKNLTLTQIFTKHAGGHAGANQIITQEQFLEKLAKETQGITDPTVLENYGREWQTNGFFRYPSSADLQSMHKKLEQKS